MISHIGKTKLIPGARRDLHDCSNDLLGCINRSSRDQKRPLFHQHGSVSPWAPYFRRDIEKGGEVSPGESKQGEVGPEEQRLGTLGVFSLWDALGWLNAEAGCTGAGGPSHGDSRTDTRDSLVVSKVARTPWICERSSPSYLRADVGRTGKLRCALRGGWSLPRGSLLKGAGSPPGYACHPQVLNLRTEATPWMGRGQGRLWPTSWHVSL